jgi:hypothetical protein
MNANDKAMSRRKASRSYQDGFSTISVVALLISQLLIAECTTPPSGNLFASIILTVSGSAVTLLPKQCDRAFSPRRAITAHPLPASKGKLLQTTIDALTIVLVSDEAARS